MTHYPDKAREAAQRIVDTIRDRNPQRSVVYQIGTEEAVRFVQDQLTAYLAASLPADEKIAEIQKYAGVRKGISEFEVLGRHSKVVESHRDYLLTLVTALSAKLKEVEETERRVRLQLLEHNELAGQHLCRAERAEAQLTAQKAAHAKMLRDEAPDWRGYP